MVARMGDAECRGAELRHLGESRLGRLVGPEGGTDLKGKARRDVAHHDELHVGCLGDGGRDVGQRAHVDQEHGTLAV